MITAPRGRGTSWQLVELCKEWTEAGCSWSHGKSATPEGDSVLGWCVIGGKGKGREEMIPNYISIIS